MQTPIQRVGRWVLLLTELLSTTEPETETHGADFSLIHYFFLVDRLPFSSMMSLTLILSALPAVAIAKALYEVKAVAEHINTCKLRWG